MKHLCHKKFDARPLVTKFLARPGEKLRKKKPFLRKIKIYINEIIEHKQIYLAMRYMNAFLLSFSNE